MARTKSESKSCVVQPRDTQTTGTTVRINAAPLTPGDVANILRLALKEGLDLASLVRTTRHDQARDHVRG